MTYIAIKVPVIESERGWGSKIDDYMITLSLEDAEEFKNEFNSVNTATSAPDWYMQAESDFQQITLTESQHKVLSENKRVWLSELKTK